MATGQPIELRYLPPINKGGYPPLPQINKGSVLFPLDSPYRHAEEEMLAGALITACIEEGEYVAIHEPYYTHVILQRYPHFFTMIPWEVKSAFQRLMDAGDIHVILIGEEGYLIPSRTLAKAVLLESKLSAYGTIDEDDSAMALETPVASSGFNTQPKLLRRILRLLRLAS